MGQEPERAKEELRQGAGVRVSSWRKFRGPLGILVTAFSVMAVVYYSLYNGIILAQLGMYIPPTANAAGSLGIIIIMGLLLCPARKHSGAARDRLPWYDIVLILAALVAYAYPSVFYLHFIESARRGYLQPMQIVLAIIALVTLFEASRRVLGMVFLLLALLSVIYLFTTEYAPGMLQMHAFELRRITFILYAGEDGIFGMATKIAATIIVMFVVFAAFMQRTAASKFFINLAIGSLGHVRGGPAKAGVIASAIFGTFSGSPTANVAATGAITIPLMKSIGYKPEFAGAVEAAASTGGLIMPPVMGAVAFVMADWLGMSYWSICIAALVPALLYYLALFIMVDAEAVRLGLRGLPRDKLPRLWPVLKEGWYWFLPIAVIAFALSVLRMDPARTGFIATLSLVPLSFIRKGDHFTLKTAVEACRGTIPTMLAPALSCGLIMIVIATVSMTGLGMKLSGTLVRIAGGNVPVLLMLAAIVSFILGMGLPSLGVYIIVVVLVAPALIQLGILPLAAHMFVFYYGMLSFVTPPVALAVFVAAALAQSESLATAAWATRLAIVAVLIPFAIIYNPAIMLIGNSSGEIFKTVALAAMGTAVIAFGAGGHAFTTVNWLQRILFVVGGFMMYLPGFWTYFPGFVVSSMTMLWHLQQWRSERTTPRAA